MTSQAVVSKEISWAEAEVVRDRLRDAGIESWIVEATPEPSDLHNVLVELPDLEQAREAVGWEPWDSYPELREADDG